MAPTCHAQGDDPDAALGRGRCVVLRFGAHSVGDALLSAMTWAGQVEALPAVVA